MLLEQQGRNQEAAQHEEEVDPERPSSRTTERVKCDDDRDREAAHAVECRSIAERLSSTYRQPHAPLPPGSTSAIAALAHSRAYVWLKLLHAFVRS